MKLFKTTLLLLLSGCFIIYGCKKSKNNITGGGIGGTLSLKVIPEHHGFQLDSCTVYIKYATNNPPTDGAFYDDSMKTVVTGTDTSVTFTNLQKGIYYIYADGYHTGYSPPYVKGGLPVTLTSNEQTYLPTYQYNK